MYSVYLGPKGMLRQGGRSLASARRRSSLRKSSLPDSASTLDSFGPGCRRISITLNPCGSFEAWNRSLHSEVLRESSSSLLSETL